MSLNNGRGQVIAKEKELLYGDFAPVVAATKHANGRDWWLVSRGYQDTNCYYMFLLDNLGVRYHHKQCIGLISKPDKGDLTNGMAFSPNGKLLSRYSKNGVDLFDFNRCTGILSNAKKAEYPYANGSYDDIETLESFQVGFSPNSQYIYTLGVGSKDGIRSKRVYQLDAQAVDFARSATKVAEYDGFRDTFGTDTNQGGWETAFFSIQIAPDNKMYLGTIDATRYLHVIEEPDKKGAACNFRQHAIKLLTIKSAIPMYPNYALGADSSSCSSSINQSTDNNEHIQVYPNPASEYLIVESPKFKVGSIKLTNLLGQEMSTLVIPAQAGIYKLDVKDLPKGIYLLTISDKENKILKQEKIVVERE